MRHTKPIDWPKVISEIETAQGKHERAIYIRLGVTAYTINSLKDGTKKMPDFDLGCDLLQLHRKRHNAAPLLGSQRADHNYISTVMTCQA